MGTIEQYLSIDDVARHMRLSSSGQDVIVPVRGYGSTNEIMLSAHELVYRQDATEELLQRFVDLGYRLSDNTINERFDWKKRCGPQLVKLSMMHLAHDIPMKLTMKFGEVLLGSIEPVELAERVIKSIISYDDAVDVIATIPGLSKADQQELISAVDPVAQNLYYRVCLATHPMMKSAMSIMSCFKRTSSLASCSRILVDELDLVG
jgi:hypothetical protein